MKKRGLQVVRTLSVKYKGVSVKSETWLVLALCAVVVTPSVLLHAAPVAGVYANAAAIVALTGLALLHAPARKIAISAAIVPMSFAVVISVPQATDFTKAVCLYSSVLLLSLVYRYLFMLDEPQTKRREVSTFRGFAAALPQAIVIGQMLAGLAFILLPRIQPFSDVPIGLLMAVVVVFALIETVFFQGLLQSAAAGTMSPLLVAALSAVLFVSLSAVTSVGTLLVSALAGTSFALIYYAKQNVLLAMLANIVMKLGFVYLITIS